MFSALACAVDDKLIASNPAVFKRGRGLPKVELAEMATLKPEQAVALLDAVRHSHIYPAALLALHTRARRGEILAMRWKSVDLDHGVVRIVQSLEQVGKTVRFKEPKTGRAIIRRITPSVTRWSRNARANGHVGARRR